MGGAAANVRVPTPEHLFLRALHTSFGGRPFAAAEAATLAASLGLRADAGRELLGELVSFYGAAESVGARSDERFRLTRPHRHVASTPDASATPFLKWAGGKGSQLDALRARAPASFGRYFEPFVGGGALFWALRPPRATVADANRQLVGAYRAVRDNVEEVIKLLLIYQQQHDRAFFLKTRTADPQDDVSIAARVIYLNKTCFNGLWRVNKQGRFNVPLGSYANPTICNAELLRRCSRALDGVEVKDADFSESVADAARGDLVYFDPPYVPISATSSFVSYTGDGFGMADQVRLRDVASKLVGRGVHVLVSNSASDVVRELYKDPDLFELREVQATRRINARASQRGAVAELLISGVHRRR